MTKQITFSDRGTRQFETNVASTEASVKWNEISLAEALQRSVEVENIENYSCIHSSTMLGSLALGYQWNIHNFLLICGIVPFPLMLLERYVNGFLITYILSPYFTLSRGIIAEPIVSIIG